MKVEFKDKSKNIYSLQNAPEGYYRFQDYSGIVIISNGQYKNIPIHDKQYIEPYKLMGAKHQQHMASNVSIVPIEISLSIKDKE